MYFSYTWMIWKLSYHKAQTYKTIIFNWNILKNWYLRTHYSTLSNALLWIPFPDNFWFFGLHNGMILLFLAFMDLDYTTLTPSFLKTIHVNSKRAGRKKLHTSSKHEMIKQVSFQILRMKLVENETLWLYLIHCTYCILYKIPSGYLVLHTAYILY